MAWPNVVCPANRQIGGGGNRFPRRPPYLVERPGGRVVEADEAQHRLVVVGVVVVPGVEHARLELGLLADEPQHVAVVVGAPVVVAVADVEGAEQALLRLAAGQGDVVDLVVRELRVALAELHAQLVAVLLVTLALVVRVDAQASDRGGDVRVGDAVEAQRPALYAVALRPRAINLDDAAVGGEARGDDDLVVIAGVVAGLDFLGVTLADAALVAVEIREDQAVAGRVGRRLAADARDPDVDLGVLVGLVGDRVLPGVLRDRLGLAHIDAVVLVPAIPRAGVVDLLVVVDLVGPPHAVDGVIAVVAADLQLVGGLAALQADELLDLVHVEDVGVRTDALAGLVEAAAVVMGAAVVGTTAVGLSARGNERQSGDGGPDDAMGNGGLEHLGTPWTEIRLAAIVRPPGVAAVCAEAEPREL